MTMTKMMKMMMMMMMMIMMVIMTMNMTMMTMMMMMTWQMMHWAQVNPIPAPAVAPWAAFPPPPSLPHNLITKHHDDADAENSRSRSFPGTPVFLFPNVRKNFPEMLFIFLFPKIVEAMYDMILRQI